MSRKVMISPLFKFPIPWMDKFYDNWNALGEDWVHCIFTDRYLISRGNIRVYRMNAEQFTNLVEFQTGVRPYVPAPSPKFGDMRPAFGHIFEKYIHGFDFWGHCDFDIVCGDLNKYATEEILSTCDIFSTEPNQVNGIFSLYRNTDFVNTYFMEHPNWKEIFQDHDYHAFDEGDFSRMIMERRDRDAFRFHGKFYQEHDNQAVHCPTPNLRLEDGKLFNSVTNEEMMIFHFKRTKTWPIF